MGNRKIVRADAGGPAIPRRPVRPGYVRLTMDVPLGLDIRLAAHARSQRVHKQDFAARLLDQGCAKYDSDKALRAAFPGPPGEAEPVA